MRERLPFFLSLWIFLVAPPCKASSRPTLQRRKPLEQYAKLFRPIVHDEPPPFSIANMTCAFMEQPLDHFELPRNRSGFYRQRYCVYDGFSSSSSSPVLFYTGNESPLEQYINHTGLMWELGEAMNAHLVFVEHRYEGQSIPPSNISNCMAYSSSYQALADYAKFIQKEYKGRPVIAFGGSYGGMLSAWLRMTYPSLVAGAIAASAPIFGFPLGDQTKIDTASQVIRFGLDLPYPPTAIPSKNHCANNLLAAWPLIKVLGRTDQGRSVLSKSFRLCKPLLTDVTDKLLEWAQSPWFDLAEGSFPYPSAYVPYALTHNPNAVLPAWPLQAACWTHSNLHQDFGIRFQGDASDVRYTISYGDVLNVSVDWDEATVISNSSLKDGVLLDRSTIVGLLSSVRDAVSVWFNVTKDVECYNLTAAPSLSHQQQQSIQEQRRLAPACSDKITEGSWNALCCNEDMNIIITEARGLGRDGVFWPPSHTRGTRTYAQVLQQQEEDAYAFCNDPDGDYGFPQTHDPWSTWLDMVYGGTNIQSQSNILWSNGLLDPWSAAGVYSLNENDTPYDDEEDVYVRNVTKNGGMVALVMKYGGHHTDLMYSNPKKDPPSITKARKIERSYIQDWIDQWNSN
jgi:lysosomal Pro-X carboxypeptidase